MGRNDKSPAELLEKAIANGYKQGAHQEEDSKKDNTKYVKKTLRDQNIALRRYEKWVVAVGKRQQETGEAPSGDDTMVGLSYTVEARSLREGLPPLDLATIKDFLRFIVATSQGLIDIKQKKVTVDSLNTFTEWFFAGFARVTGNCIDGEDRRAVYDWTRNTLTKEGLVVNKKKPKHLFGEKELVRFTNTFWTVDDDHFIHPRNKVQVPFIIAVFCWTGARIGAFFPDKKDDSKKGLQYRDIELVLKRIPGGGWKSMYRIDQRWVKNNRDPENTVYGVSTTVADNAIWGINSLDDFWQLQIPNGEDELLLRWQDSVVTLPILRNATMQQGVTKEPLLKRTFDRIVKSVLNLSGYFGNATVHAIRRYLAKKVQGRYTAVELAQHINHTDPRIYGQSYVANTSAVCGKSAFLNEVAQHDHVDYFQSFAKFRENGLPTKLPAQEEDAIRRDPQLLELEADVQRLKRRRNPTCDIKAAESRARAYRASLTKKRLQQYKFEWIRERRDWKVKTRGKESPGDEKRTDLLDILSRVMPERGRLARVMISDHVVSEDERKEAIQDLCALASRDCTVLYRPGEQPIQGLCPVKECGLSMISLRKPHRSTHIHNCRQRGLAKILERLESELKYCFTYFDWFVEEEWAQHCRTHLGSLSSKRCASVTYCNTLFRPAFCPFCMGDDRLPASSRWSSWTREAKLWNHLGTHLEASSWPMDCPHPSCRLQLQDEISFLFHLSDVHSLRMSPYMRKSWQSGRDLEPPIRWMSDTTAQKRRTQDSDEQEMRASKQRKMTLTIDSMGDLSSWQSEDRNTPNSVPIVSPYMLSKVIYDNVPEDHHREDLPQLTHSGTTSPLENDNPSLIDECCPCDTIQHQDLHNKLEWWNDSVKTPSDKCEPLTRGNEDALFSQYLRSWSSSPSASPQTGSGNRDDPSKRCPPTVSGEINLHAKEACLPTIYTNQDFIETCDASTKLKKTTYFSATTPTQIEVDTENQVASEPTAA